MPPLPPAPEPSRSHDALHSALPRRVRRHAGRGPARIGLHLTAMIDIVFLLLTYFMVATKFKLGEEIFRMDLPERGVAAVVDPFDLDDEPLVIRVSTTVAVPTGYRIQIDGPFDQPQTFTDLFRFLQQRQITAERFDGLFAPDHPIVIEPTAATRWDHAVDAYNAAARARYENISFAPPG